MPKIRILLVHPVGMLLDIVRDVIVQEHGLLIVERLSDVTRLPEVLDRTRADVIICGLDGPDLAETWHLLLRSHPHIKVLDLHKDGRQAFLWELRLHRTVLGEPSPCATHRCRSGGSTPMKPPLVSSVGAEFAAPVQQPTHLTVAENRSLLCEALTAWDGLPRLLEALDALVECQSRHEQASRTMQETSRELERINAERRMRLRDLEHLLGAAGVQLPRSARTTAIRQRDATAGPAGLPPLAITCFGGFEVRRGGQLVRLCASRNGQAILRFLVAQPRRRASMDILVDALWPEDVPDVARHKLHCAFSALRRSLNEGYTDLRGGGYLLCRNSMYELNPAIDMRIDADELRTRHRSGQQADGTSATVHYEAACALYKGPFLPEDLYADWSLPHREQLEKTYLLMCGALAAHYLGAARPDEAAEWASRIIDVRRCDEAAFRLLMQASAAAGRRHEVVHQYRRCELLLREDLGVEPSCETTALLQMILSGAGHISGRAGSRQLTGARHREPT